MRVAFILRSSPNTPCTSSESGTVQVLRKYTATAVASASASASAGANARCCGSAVHKVPAYCKRVQCKRSGEFGMKTPLPNRKYDSGLTHGGLTVLAIYRYRGSFRCGFVPLQTQIVIEDRHLQQRQHCREGCFLAFLSAAAFPLPHVLSFTAVFAVKCRECWTDGEKGNQRSRCFCRP